jgi:alkylhydroperoxidase/carboxymuconolactone decarboxylase family protein YurZ
MNNTPLFFIFRKENLQEKTEEIISIYLSKTAKKKGCEVELKKKIEISPT